MKSVLLRIELTRALSSLRAFGKEKTSIYFEKVLKAVGIVEELSMAVSFGRSFLCVNALNAMGLIDDVVYRVPLEYANAALALLIGLHFVAVSLYVRLKWRRDGVGTEQRKALARLQGVQSPFNLMLF